MCMQNTMHGDCECVCARSYSRAFERKHGNWLIYAFHILLQAKIQYENVMPMRAYTHTHTCARKQEIELITR